MAAEIGVRNCFDSGFADAIPHKTLGRLHIGSDIMAMPYSPLLCSDLSCI